VTLSLQPQQEDERTTRRVAADLSIGLAITSKLSLFSPRKPQFEAHVHEVSVPGMQIDAPLNLEPGSKVVLWISVAPSELTDKPIRMKMKGQVVWCKQHDTEEGRFVAGIHLRAYPNHSFATWQKFALACIRNRKIAARETLRPSHS
jgi:hypothetical protein